MYLLDAVLLRYTTFWGLRLESVCWQYSLATSYVPLQGDHSSHKQPEICQCIGLDLQCRVNLVTGFTLKNFLGIETYCKIRRGDGLAWDEFVWRGEGVENAPFNTPLPRNPNMYYRCMVSTLTTEDWCWKFLSRLTTATNLSIVGLSCMFSINVYHDMHIHNHLSSPLTF